MPKNEFTAEQSAETLVAALETERALIASSFEDFMNTVRDLRVAVGRQTAQAGKSTVSDSDATKQLIDAVLMKLREAADAGSGQSEETVDLLALANRLTEHLSELSSAMSRGDALAAHPAFRDGGAAQSGSDAASMRKLQLPISRLASLTQESDWLDQRMSHCIAGIPVVDASDEGANDLPAKILAAQVESVGMSLSVIAAGVGKAADTLARHFDLQSEAAGGPQGSQPNASDIENLADDAIHSLNSLFSLARQMDGPNPFADVLTSPDIATLTDALQFLASSSSDGSSAPSWMSPHLIALQFSGSGFAGLSDAMQTRAQSMIGYDAQIGASAEKTDPTVVALGKLYTCDIEHEVHASVLSGRPMNAAAGASSAVHADSHSADF